MGVTTPTLYRFIDRSGLPNTGKGFRRRSRSEPGNAREHGRSELACLGCPRVCCQTADTLPMATMMRMSHSAHAATPT